MAISCELRVSSPAGAPSEAFIWTKRTNGKTTDANRELYDCLNFILFDVKELTENKTMLNEFYAVDWNCFESVSAYCNLYNSCIAKVRTKWSENDYVPEFFNRLAKTHQLKYILTHCYNRAIDDPEKLNQYPPFSPQVYGETSFELIAQMIDTVNMSSEDSFIDLGSGVGQVVLQVAASTDAKFSYGIEKADYPANCASKLDSEFRRWMAFYGKKYQPYKLEQGDFLSQDCTEKIISSSVVFANNFAFGPEVDHQLKLRFANLKEGAKVIASRAFCSRNFRITDRKLDDIGSIMHVTCLNPLHDAVSWTDKPFVYFVHTIDRSSLEQYFSKLKNPKAKGFVEPQTKKDQKLRSVEDQHHSDEGSSGEQKNQLAIPKDLHSKIGSTVKRKSALTTANKKQATLINKPASSADSQQSTPDSFFRSEGDEEESQSSSSMLLCCLEESTSFSSSLASSSSSSSGVSSLLLPDQSYRRKPPVLSLATCVTEPFAHVGGSDESSSVTSPQLSPFTKRLRRLRSSTLEKHIGPASSPIVVTKQRKKKKERKNNLNLNEMHVRTVESVPMEPAAITPIGITSSVASYNDPEKSAFVQSYEPLKLEGIAAAQRHASQTAGDHVLRHSEEPIPLALAQYLELTKRVYMNQFAVMRTPEYLMRIQDEVEKEQTRRAVLADRINSLEKEIKLLHVEGSLMLSNFTKRLGILVSSPAAFFSEARKLIKLHRQLEERIDDLRSEVCRLSSSNQNLVRRHQEEATRLQTHLLQRPSPLINRRFFSSLPEKPPPLLPRAEPLAGRPQTYHKTKHANPPRLRPAERRGVLSPPPKLVRVSNSPPPPIIKSEPPPPPPTLIPVKAVGKRKSEPLSPYSMHSTVNGIIDEELSSSTSTAVRIAPKRSLSKSHDSLKLLAPLLLHSPRKRHRTTLPIGRSQANSGPTEPLCVSITPTLLVLGVGVDNSVSSLPSTAFHWSTIKNAPTSSQCEGV